MLVQTTKAAAKTKAPVARQQHGSGILAKLDIVSFYTLHPYTYKHAQAQDTKHFFPFNLLVIPGDEFLFFKF